MSHKRWKLVVSELGQPTALHEVVVDAGDWMTALTRARAQIGERGGVPPGASCQIAPDGTASITDGVARRRYLLTPTTESKAPPAAAAPAAAAPATAAPAAAAPAPLTKKQKQQTMAYMPSQHGALPGAPASVAVGAAPAPVAAAATPASATQSAPAAQAPAAQPAPATRSAPAMNRTVSFSTDEVRAAAQSIAVGQAGPVAPMASAPAPTSPRPASVPPPAAAATASAAPRPASVPPPSAVVPAASPKKVLKQTMAYMPAETAKAMQEAVAAAQGNAAAPPAAQAAAPAPAAPVAAAPVAAAPPAGAAPADTIRTAAPAMDDGLELLMTRDAEPTKESPLIYRERHFLLPPGADPDEAEMLLRRRFAALREELSSRPKGKLVKMALFDHRWSGQPTRPPVLALQWKNWRGEPEISAPARMSMAGPPQAVSPSLAPVIAQASAAAPAAGAPASAAPSSIVVDPSLAAPAPIPLTTPAAAAAPIPLTTPGRSAPAAAALPAQPAAAPMAATGSSKRNRKATPGGALADDRLADAFEGLQDLFFLASAFEGVEFTMRLIADLIPCEAQSIALYDINSHELRFVSTSGTGAEERKGDAVPTTAGLIGAALADWNRSLLVTDVNADARFDPGIDGRVGLDLHNMLVMPVASQGRLLALVQLMNRTGDLEFSQSDSNLIAYIASRLGEFLIQTKMAADRPSSTKNPRPTPR